MKNEKEDNKSERRREVEKNLIKYSSMSFKMAFVIILGVYLGDWLDKKFEQEKFPTFTLIFSLSSVILATYSMIRDLTKK